MLYRYSAVYTIQQFAAFKAMIKRAINVTQFALLEYVLCLLLYGRYLTVPTHIIVVKILVLSVYKRIK